jgi:hypothetical protein
MVTRAANYSIEHDVPGQPLIIRDAGPWNKFLTVTNAAEEVVEDLVRAQRLPNGRRLLYFDSYGQLDEIVVRDGKFAGFKRGPK